MKWIFFIALVCGTVALAKERPVVTIHVHRSQFDDHPAAGLISRATFRIESDVTMPDGSKAMIWCEREFRTCSYLEPGDYKAEISKDTVWIFTELPIEKTKYSPDGALLPRKSQLFRIKFRIAYAHH